jgi:predicted TIM-barrel fold metal-dependent hydrolase
MIVDADVHAILTGPAGDGVNCLAPYLARQWTEYMAISQFRGPTDGSYPPSAATSLRSDAGATPMVNDQVDAAVVSCSYAVDSVHNPDAADALARAVNQWLAAEWLAADDRLHGTILVTPQSPDDAVKQIAEAAATDRYVQIALPVRSLAPYGERRYWPIFEAAVAAGLAVALHFGGSPGLAPTATGWPTYYAEEYVDMASSFQVQLASIVLSGLLSRLPELRLVAAESGTSWLPGMTWRLDRLWRALRREVPWVERPPSEYLREHLRFTLQPFDGGASPELLMYSSDYPHWHGDDTGQSWLASLSADQRAGVLGGNAAHWYRIPHAN